MAKAKYRSVTLTAKGYDAIDVSPTVFVPLLEVDWYEDDKREPSED